MTPCVSNALTHSVLSRPGWSDPGLITGGGRRDVLNPVTGVKVQGGRFGFSLNTNRVFAELIPCHGKDNVVPSATRRLRGLTTSTLDCLVVVLDGDNHDPDVLRKTVMAQLVAARPASASCEVHVVVWFTPHRPTPGVPAQQTLERVASLAVANWMPNRAAAVQVWLDGRPDKPVPNEKSFSLSYAAGWWPDDGNEYFFRHVWSEPETRTRLTEVVSDPKCGAIAAIESIER